MAGIEILLDDMSAIVRPVFQISTSRAPYPQTGRLHRSTVQSLRTISRSELWPILASPSVWGTQTTFPLESTSVLEALLERVALCEEYAFSIDMNIKIRRGEVPITVEISFGRGVVLSVPLPGAAQSF